MERLGKAFFSKATKIIFTYIFLIGTLIGIVFSFTDYIYATDPITNETGPTTSTEFSNNYEFLIKVDKRNITSKELTDIAVMVQENLNYLGFSDAMVNTEGTDSIRVTLPLYGNNADYSDLMIDQTVAALKVMFSGPTEIGFYDSNGVSLFGTDTKDVAYNTTGVAPDELPQMIEPGSAKAVVENGYITIEFVPNGEDGHNAFIDAFTALGNSSSTPTEGSATNAMYVWINYDKLYSLISYADPDGLAASENLYNYCLPVDIDGNKIYNGTYKKVCEPYIITVQQVKPMTNPNFKTIQLVAPITGSFDADLANYYVNQMNFSTQGISFEVTQSGWIDHEYSNQQLVYSFIIFAILIMLMLILVISYYGLIGVLISLISSLTYLITFIVLFSTGIQFSFLVSAIIFMFISINMMMYLYVANKFKQRLSWTKKTPSKAFTKTLKNTLSVLFSYSAIVLVAGFVTYIYGYQQIAIIGITIFLISLLFVGFYVFVFIPGMYFILGGINEKLDVSSKNYNYIVGKTSFKEIKAPSEKLLSKDKEKKYLKILNITTVSLITVFLSVVTIMMVLPTPITNTSFDKQINTYRYDVVLQTSAVTSVALPQPGDSTPPVSGPSISSLDYMSQEEVDSVVNEFSQYTNVDGYTLGIDEQTTCDFSTPGIGVYEIGEVTEKCYITRTPSLIVYTTDKLTTDQESQIIADLYVADDSDTDDVSEEVSYAISTNGVKSSTHIVDYSLTNVAIILSILFVVALFILIVIGKWSLMTAAGWSLFIQTIGLFTLSIVFFIPMNTYFVYSLLLSFIVGLFTKVVYTYQLRREMGHLHKKLLSEEDVTNSTKLASKNTLRVIVASYTILALSGIVLAIVGGLQLLSFALPMIISAFIGILIDTMMLPLLSKKLETIRQNKKAKNWKDDLDISKDRSKRTEQLVEGINC